MFTSYVALVTRFPFLGLEIEVARCRELSVFVDP